MLSNSMFLPGDRQLLQQKVFILQQELQEYKMKQSKLSRLNQSILQTYKLNQTIKQTQQQQTKKQNRQLITKHRQEIRKLKSQFTKDKSQLENQNYILKQKLKLSEDTLQKIKLQHQQNLIDIKTTLENKHQKLLLQIENKHQKVIEELQNKHNTQIKNTNEEMNNKIQELSNYIQELQHQNQLYQQYIQRKQQFQKQNHIKTINLKNSNSHEKSHPIQSKNNYHPTNFKNDMFKSYEVKSPLYPQLIKQPFYDQQNQNQKYQIKTLPKQSKKLISQLGTKINNALKEINQNKLHHYH